MRPALSLRRQCTPRLRWGALFFYSNDDFYSCQIRFLDLYCSHPRGRGSVVERLLAKEKVTGSNPVARSGTAPAVGSPPPRKRPTWRFLIPRRGGGEGRVLQQLEARCCTGCCISCCKIRRCFHRAERFHCCRQHPTVYTLPGRSTGLLTCNMNCNRGCTGTQHDGAGWALITLAHLHPPPC
jgi:hypothetical protein